MADRREFLKRLAEVNRKVQDRPQEDISGRMVSPPRGKVDPMSRQTPEQEEAAQRERSMRALERLGVTGLSQPGSQDQQALKPREGISMDEMDRNARASAQKLADDQMALKEPLRPQYADDDAYAQAMDPYQQGQQLNQDPDFRKRFIDEQYKKNYEALRQKHLGK